jgi:hypothetical protein
MSYISNLERNTYDETKMRFGPAGGISIIGNLSTNWAIQLELLYMSKGSKKTSKGCLESVVDQRCDGDNYWDNYETLSFEFELNYLEIPLLIKKSYPGEHISQAFLIGGGYLGFLLSSEGYFVGTESGYSFQGELSFARETDFGFIFGCGIEIALKYTALTLEARYAQSVLDLQSPEALYNGAFSFMVGMIY